MRTSLQLFFLICFGYANCQYYKAVVDENYQFSYTPVEATSQIQLRATPEAQLPGYPKGFPANPAFKNFRNVTLADLDEDGIPEILTAINQTIYVFKGDQLLWNKPLEGLGLYPPSVADIDKDGRLEVVQVTGGQGFKGRIYVFDFNGNISAPWPKNFKDHWILVAPVLSDVDDDGQMEIIVLERETIANTSHGYVHILNLDGTSYSENWPVKLDATPSVTPSVGDIDNDGEKDIVVYSTATKYAFDLEGNIKPGWGFSTFPSQRYSYQSPILVDFDQNGTLEIVGATHGDAPQYYILDAKGDFLENWPKDTPNGQWTFTPPTVVQIQDTFHILMGLPLKEKFGPMLYDWQENGVLRPDFPIQKQGGLEGLISVADIDDDGAFELVFGSEMVDENGYGYIHAFELDGKTEVKGFPLRTRGWTYLNGVNIGDINGNGKMDLIALSSTIETISGFSDTTYLNVFELETQYSPDKVLWATYKGSNTRDGLIKSTPLTSTHFSNPIPEISVRVFPNPAVSEIHVELQGLFSSDDKIEMTVRSIDGNLVQYKRSRGNQIHHVLPLNLFHSGLYFLEVRSGKNKIVRKIVIP